MNTDKQNPAATSGDAPTDAEIVEALHSCGIDTRPSKYGFNTLQIDGTSVPNLRNVFLKLAASIERAAAPAPAEISERLRRIVANRGESGCIAVRAELLTQAADECDRFYGGMMAWKRTAEAKDREFAESRAAVSAATKPASAPDRNDILEEAAKLCEEMEGDMFDQYKGRGKHAPNNPYRADPYMNGQSDGAGQCAIGIRKLMRNPAVASAAPTAAPAEQAGSPRSGRR